MTARDDFSAAFRRLRARTRHRSADIARTLAQREVLRIRNRDAATKDFLTKRWQSRLSSWGRGNDLPHNFDMALKPALILMYQLVAESEGTSMSANAAEIQSWEAMWRRAREETLDAKSIKTDAPIDIFRESLPSPPQWAPGFLLRPEYAVVPFEGREEIITNLQTWCTNGDPLLRLIAAPGGYGKTRLAETLIQTMSARGWTGGFVRPDLESDWVSRLQHNFAGALLVFDYAETRVNQVRQVIEWSMRHHDVRVKILLIARSSGSWIDNLRSQSAEAEMATEYSRIQDPMGGLLMLQEPFNGLRRLEMFINAGKAFAQRLQVPETVEIEIPTLLQLSSRSFSCLLQLHMSALATVLAAIDGERDLNGALNDPITRIIGHEQRYWRSLADELNAGIPLPTLRRSMVFISTFGAKNRDDVARLLSEPSSLAVSQPQIDGATMLAEIIYPTASDAERYGSIQPDLLAEDLATIEFSASKNTLLSTLARVEDWQRKSALTLLDRASQRHPEAAELLKEAAISIIESSPEVVIETITESWEPLRLVEAVAIRLRGPGDTELKARLVRYIPQYTIAMSEIGVELFEWVIEGHRQAMSSGNAEDEFQLTHLLSEYGTLLDRRNRLNDALQARTEARERYEVLHREHPEITTLADLGVFIDHEASSYARLGQSDKALILNARAISLLRELLRDRLGDIRGSYFETVAERLVKEGRELSTDVVIEFMRPVTDLGVALVIRADILNDGHRFEEAIPCASEAIKTLQWLKAPDGSPNPRLENLLAWAQQQLSRSLANTDQLREAIQVSSDAIATARELAAAEPDEFLAFLHNALSSHLPMVLKAGLVIPSLETAQELLSCITLIENAAPSDHAGRYSEQKERLGALIQHLRRIAK